MRLLIFLLAMTQQDSNTFDFTALQNNQTMIVNDGVMGGRSSSTLSRVQNGLKFSGSVSLENNGGFASARMIWPFNKVQTQQAEMVVLTVTGDGSSYQFRLRTNRGFDGAAYTQSFSSLNQTRQTIYLPVAEFVPTFRGRVLQDMPVLSLDDVQQMGLLIADKQTGSFNITLHAISVQ
ncbi:CIA30 family protein [Marinicella sediminis]|uniref:CIA30 family protein n=1 Tax=Marinicella sediminis TaxID=1792834 RepID=A0ABV7JCW1_9GAMM|nr:CIA30 family protein [Marinicella sediminis]